MMENGRSFSKRRGSALLIVMGMFAFMIVSAVSFSVYMRSSRKPSSFVRRNALSRQIVRAALARAIEEVDTAIGNDPFPGFGRNHQISPEPGKEEPFSGETFANRIDDRRCKDLWYGRVFTPSNACSLKTTVPTLTLEALGYLPPPLINEVRYGSRHTRTAQWRSFNYGLGRYAFTAVNVSDFFNLTDLVIEEGADAGKPRPVNRSSAPYTRVTPAYLFSKAAKINNPGMSDSFADFEDPDICRKFYNNLKPDDYADVPLVSMMDYNLALGEKLNGLGLEVPFYKTIRGQYNDNQVFDYERKNVIPQMFVVGGWDGSEPLASSESANPQNYIDLQNPLHQPLRGNGFPQKITFQDADHSTDFWKRTAALNSRPNHGDRNASLVENCIPVLGQRLLADYLDYDSVPISLCIPSAEETPMIVYAELNNDCVKWTVRVQEDETQAANPSADPPVKRRVKKTFFLKVEVDADIIFGTVYPFKFSPKNGRTYKLDCFMRVFFTADSGNVWTAGGLRATGDGLKLESGAVGNGSFKWGDIQNQTRAAAYFQLKADGPAVDAKDVVGQGKQAEKNAVQQHSPINCAWAAPEVPLAAIEYELNDQNQPETIVNKQSGNDLGAEFTVFDGAWEAKSASVDDFDEILHAGGASTPIYRPSVAIWARIRDNNNHTVDMVPATPSYDNVDGDGYREVFDVGNGEGFFSAAGGGTPLLRFFPKTDGDSEIQFNHKFFSDNNGSEKTVKWLQKAYAANDPRYNWAPEDWKASDDGDNPKENGWLNKVRTFQDNHPNQCDSDIFMQVSDQGYLQSMYELMMIPQVSPIADSVNAIWGKLEGTGAQYNGVLRGLNDSALHEGLMWRTYRSDAFWHRANESDHYYDNPEYRIWGSIEDIGFVESKEGMRVNPYTDLTSLFVGALANMPRDWWAAGTNFAETAEKSYMKPGDSDALKVKEDYLMDLDGEQVMDMARFMMAEFKNNVKDDFEKEANIAVTNNMTNPEVWMWWEHVFNYWNWPMSGTTRFDEYTLRDLDDDKMNDLMTRLTSVDRKFLYGYLKGCFDVKSQLFLIFVRAEPSDGGEGGRAVALVWRDPKPDPRTGKETEDNAGFYLYRDNEVVPVETWRLQLDSRAVPPHRTRILFYRHLD